MINACTVELVGWTADAMAARQAALGDPGTPLPCTVQARASETEEDGRAQQNLTTYEVIFPDDPGVRIRDRLTWVDGGDRVLTVTGIRNASGRSASWVVDAVEVN